MKIEALPLTPELFHQHAGSVPGSGALKPSLDTLISGESAVLLETGKCFGMGGFLPLWPGVAEVWMLLDPERFRYPVYLRRWARKTMRRAINRFDLHRIQGAADILEPHHARWLESLGLTYEGTLRKYTFDGRDMALYALTI